jgi:Leucine-rich repeat (LRR) protein
MSYKINYGDGVVDSFNNLTRYSVSRLNPEDAHEYIDGNTSNRFVTFEFQDLTKIDNITIRFANVTGFFPVEVGFIKNLKQLSLRSTNVDSFPPSFFDLRNLDIVSLRSALSFQFPTIFDGIFLNDLIELVLSSSFDLEDHIRSNFFKINQLSSTLTYLNIQRCNLTDLPVEIESLKKLTDLWALFNNFSKLPTEVLELPELENLKLGDGTVNDTTMLDFRNPNCKNIEQLTLRISNLDFSEISIKWSGLKSLDSIRFFGDMVTTNARFDEFTDQMYDLVIENGFLDTLSTEAQLNEFPEQFRDMVWGASSLTQTGTIEAPPQFVQGSNNGNPINQGQKIYVLVNNYGHTITTS